MNVIQIKHGDGSPANNKLKERELAISDIKTVNNVTTGGDLYVGVPDGNNVVAKKIGGIGTIFFEEITY